MVNLLEILDRTDRACLGSNPELFFPGPGNGAVWALDICSQCPVKPPCREYAMERPLLHGVWGGTTWEDRTAMRKKVRRG